MNTLPLLQQHLFGLIIQHSL